MAYTYSRTLTLNHTLVPNTDQTNFPVLFTGTYPYLATTANGGAVQNASGYDIVFAPDAAGATLLPWELENYNPATGAITAWVKIPTLSHTADTVIYLLYGNAAVTTSQTTASAAWDANYGAVWHLGNGSTLSLADSTANGNTITNHGGTAAAGTIGGAIALNGSSAWAQITGSASLRPAKLTAQALVKFAGFNAYQKIISMPYYGNTNNWSAPYDVYGMDSGQSGGNLRATVATSGTETDNSGSTAFSTGAWYWVALTFDGANTRTFINGAQDSIAATYSANLDYTNPGDLAFGVDGAGQVAEFLNGALDEVRISSLARSADWLKTEYNNQSNPAGFYTLGAAVGGAAAASRLMLLGCGA